MSVVPFLRRFATRVSDTIVARGVSRCFFSAVPAAARAGRTSNRASFHTLRARKTPLRPTNRSNNSHCRIGHTKRSSWTRKDASTDDTPAENGEPATQVRDGLADSHPIAHTLHDVCQAVYRSIGTVAALHVSSTQPAPVCRTSCTLPHAPRIQIASALLADTPAPTLMQMVDCMMRSAVTVWPYPESHTHSNSHTGSYTRLGPWTATLVNEDRITHDRVRGCVLVALCDVLARRAVELSGSQVSYLLSRIEGVVRGKLGAVALLTPTERVAVWWDGMVLCYAVRHRLSRAEALHCLDVLTRLPHPRRRGRPRATRHDAATDVPSACDHFEGAGGGGGGGGARVAPECRPRRRAVPARESETDARMHATVPAVLAEEVYCAVLNYLLVRGAECGAGGAMSSAVFVGGYHVTQLLQHSLTVAWQCVHPAVQQGVLRFLWLSKTTRATKSGSSAAAPLPLCLRQQHQRTQSTESVMDAMGGALQQSDGFALPALDRLVLAQRVHGSSSSHRRTLRTYRNGTTGRNVPFFADEMEAHAILQETLPTVRRRSGLSYLCALAEMYRAVWCLERVTVLLHVCQCVQACNGPALLYDALFIRLTQLVPGVLRTGACSVSCVCANRQTRQEQNINRSLHRRVSQASARCSPVDGDTSHCADYTSKAMREAYHSSHDTNTREDGKSCHQTAQKQAVPLPLSLSQARNERSGEAVDYNAAWERQRDVMAWVLRLLPRCNIVTAVAQVSALLDSSASSITTMSSSSSSPSLRTAFPSAQLYSHETTYDAAAKAVSLTSFLARAVVLHVSPGLIEAVVRQWVSQQQHRTTSALRAPSWQLLVWLLQRHRCPYALDVVCKEAEAVRLAAAQSAMAYPLSSAKPTRRLTRATRELLRSFLHREVVKSDAEEQDAEATAAAAGDSLCERVSCLCWSQQQHERVWRARLQRQLDLLLTEDEKEERAWRLTNRASVVSWTVLARCALVEQLGYLTHSVVAELSVWREMAAMQQVELRLSQRQRLLVERSESVDG